MSAPEKSARVPGAYAADIHASRHFARDNSHGLDPIKNPHRSEAERCFNQADLAGDAVGRRKLAGFPRLIELLSKAFERDRIIERRPGRRPVASEAAWKGKGKR
jgi:hypothetical protein